MRCAPTTSRTPARAPSIAVLSLSLIIIVLSPTGAPRAGDEPPGAGARSGAPAAEKGSPAKPAVPSVTTLAGELRGAVRFPRAPGSEEIAVDGRPARLDEVITIDFPAKLVSSGEVFVLLRSGEEIFGTIAGGDEAELRIRAWSARPAGGEKPWIAIPLEAVAGVGLPRNFPDPSEGMDRIRRWLAPEEKPEGAAGGEGKAEAREGQDRVHLTEGAILDGVLQRIDGETLRFQSNSAGEVTLPLAKVRALRLADEGTAEKKDPKEAGVTAVVQVQDGSSLIGRILAISPAEPAEASAKAAGRGELRLASRALGEITAPLDRIGQIRFLGGRCQYLSDLAPAKVTHKKDLFRPWEIRRDRSATGDPISMRGQLYRKGLGMHSHTRADYDLGGGFTRFQAVIGMDDRARPETDEARRSGAGTAVFRVHVDDKVVLERKLSWSDPPAPIEVPLEGARTLGLELDHGPGFIVLGRGNWADARIIKKN